jgi:hypothetical protein
VYFEVFSPSPGRSIKAALSPLSFTLPIMSTIAAIEKLVWFSISENKQKDSTTAKKASVAASYVATL